MNRFLSDPSIIINIKRIINNIIYCFYSFSLFSLLPFQLHHLHQGLGCNTFLTRTSFQVTGARCGERVSENQDCSRLMKEWGNVSQLQHCRLE